MSSKNTWLWLVLAAALFAVITLLNRHFQATVPAALVGWPNFQVSQATNLEIIPVGALEIQADRSATNENWNLSKPFAYPGQTAAIHALLASLDQLSPDIRITASELRQQPSAEQDYGFDVPQTSLVIKTPQQQWQLKIGRRTAPGNQVYLQVVGVDGAFVTDAGWLKYLPRTATDWRDTSLVNSEGIYDWIVLTNGAKVIELKLDPTNHFWRMTRPLQARADSDRINRALQQLRAGRVEKFVTDDAHTDLSVYELQPPNLDLWLGDGATLSAGLHLGKVLTNNSTLVYARREGWNGVINTLNEPLSPWRGTVNDFRSPRLIESTARVNEIEVWVASEGDHYILRRQGARVWQVAGENFPVDAQTMQGFISLLAGLRATDYVRDAVTAQDLQDYGLAKPEIQITLRPTAGDTNQTIAQLSFSVRTNGVFACRSDEDFIYRVDPGLPQQIHHEGWEFRDRQVWNFKEQDITQIAIHQDGQTRQILHGGKDQWTLAPGSPGQIFPPSIEETAHQLGQLAAIGWVGHNITKPAAYGVTTNSLQIEVTLKNNQTYVLQFGSPIYQTTLAMVSLNGEPWVLALSPELYQLILSYLTIPAKFN